VAALEAAMIATCAANGVTAVARDGHPGAWVAGERGRPPRKVGALGLRIERGVSYHGIALNVDPDLRDFDLIDPCGMPGLVSTSIAEELGRSAEPPSTAAVEAAGRIFAEAFAAGLDAPLAWQSAEALRPGAAPAPEPLVPVETA
jgi:lipoyl(octanoyl) transferase